MKKPPLEKTIVNNVLKRVRLRGGYWLKIHGSQWQQAGVPDIIGCYHGRYVSFEVKRDAAGKPTDLQAHTMKRIRTEGGVSILIHSVDMALAVLDRLDALQEARVRKRNSKPPQSGD